MFENFENNLHLKGYSFIAGIDEAGRGPLAGPVVAASVIFPTNYLIDGVNDSKLLNETKRKYYFEKIINESIAFGIGIISESVIDRINILNATFLAMYNSINNLSVKPEFLLVDGNRFYDSDIPYKTIVKGDRKCFTIASASIIAKVFRDYLLYEYSELFSGYDLKTHKGYGTKKHLEAIKKFGYSDLHRKSFIIKSKNILS